MFAVQAQALKPSFEVATGLFGRNWQHLPDLQSLDYMKIEYF